MNFNHTSVMLDETMGQLNMKPDGTYVDGTLGGGGHSYEICKHLSRNGKLIGIDQDEDAICAATLRLAEFNEKVRIVRSNYVHMKHILSEEKVNEVDGIILDLGVSSYQIDARERGFTYMEESAPLDMRMDNRQKFTAKELINTYSETQLFHIIRNYGEDKFAKNIAKHIVRERNNKTIETTGELTEIIRHAIPIKIQKMGGHPAKKTFQAIRIELNQELEVLKNSLDEMIELLKPNARLCIITFHSLEDRIVKNKFREAENPCTCPKEFPICVCGQTSKGKVITRKPIVPSEEELRENSRSKSAKLRVFEKR